MPFRELSGAHKGTHKKRLSAFEMFDRDNFRITVDETYTTQSLRKTDSGCCTNDYLHRSAWGCSLLIDTWKLVGSKRARDICVLCVGLGSGSASSCDVERGEERF